MEYLIGFLLAIGVIGFARASGLDRDRAFYPVMLVVVASYYVLFAVMGGSKRILTIEILMAGGFSLCAVLGFKRNLWIVAAALAGHGVFDFVRHFFILNAGVPHWWPGFCSTFDLLAGAFVGFRLIKHPDVLG